MANEAKIAVLTVILMGILEVIKELGLNKKFVPAMSLGLGILIGIVYSGFDVREGVFVGAIIGLSAVGLYSGSTNIAEGIKNKLNP